MPVINFFMRNNDREASSVMVSITVCYGRIVDALECIRVENAESMRA